MSRTQQKASASSLQQVPCGRCLKKSLLFTAVSTRGLKLDEKNAPAPDISLHIHGQVITNSQPSQICSYFKWSLVKKNWIMAWQSWKNHLGCCFGQNKTPMHLLKMFVIIYVSLIFKGCSIWLRSGRDTWIYQSCLTQSYVFSFDSYILLSE